MKFFVAIVAMLSIVTVAGSAARATDACAPGTSCLRVSAKGVVEPDGAYIAQCAGRYPDFIVNASSLDSKYVGPWFSLAQDFPTTVPNDAYPWLSIPFAQSKVDADAYLYALRDYAFDGMVEADFRPEKTKKRAWYNMPLMNFSHPREYIHGTTDERPLSNGEIGLKPGAVVQSYAVGFYNAAAATVLANVWNAPKPSFDSVKFPEGSMAFKVLFSTAKDDDFADSSKSPLRGAPEWTVGVGANGTKVRLIQMDVAAADHNAGVSGWVFGTFAFDPDAPDTSPWRRLRPVGLSWGNDPGFTPADQAAGRNLVETIISDEIPGYARTHLGWAGRTNGPIDDPISGCISCHGTAQFPVAAVSKPRLSNGCDSDDKRLYWFRDFSGSTPFGAVNFSTCFPEPAQEPLRSLDFSLQLQVALQSLLQPDKNGVFNQNPCETPQVTVSSVPQTERGRYADAPLVER